MFRKLPKKQFVIECTLIINDCISYYHSYKFPKRGDYSWRGDNLKDGYYSRKYGIACIE